MIPGNINLSVLASGGGGPPPPPPGQSYSNYEGSGSRRAPVLATTTATSAAGDVTYLLDGTGGNTWQWNNGQSGLTVTFDLEASTEDTTHRVIDEATWLQSTTDVHGTWQWAGSNDNVTYTNIGSTFTLGGSTSQVLTTLHGNATAYRYYQLQQTGGTTSGTPFLQSLTFRIDAALTLGYFGTYGVGNRTSAITVTSTAVASGSPSQLLDGSFGQSYYWVGGQTGLVVHFDFGTGVIVNEAFWYQSAAIAEGTWQWQGSNDDSTWTNIGSTFTLGGAVMQRHTQLNGNTTSYRYYRMEQTGGTTSNASFLLEIEFSTG